MLQKIKGILNWKREKIRHLSYFFLYLNSENLFKNNLMIETLKISYYLIPILVILVGYFYYSFQKLRKVETERLQFLYAEILLEKEIAHQFKNVPKKVNRLNNSIEQKISKIKVAIFNIDFSLSEIFS